MSFSAQLSCEIIYTEHEISSDFFKICKCPERANKDEEIKAQAGEADKINKLLHVDELLTSLKDFSEFLVTCLYVGWHCA